MHSRFVVYCGPMFSSKTTRLLSELDRFRIRRKDFLCFKPRIDDRYSEGEIVTHSGMKIPAQLVEDGSEILYHIVNYKGEERPIIAVDEAFMIPGVADALITLHQQGFTILISTIDLSASCIPFDEVTKILPYATEIHKCTAVCTECGDNAHYTYRKFDNSDLGEISVGGFDKYEPRCQRHHPHFE